MNDIYFYKYLVNKQVFYRSKHCYALVNLKPLIDGHILLVPYNPKIARFSQLNQEESIDYMNSLQTLTKFLTWEFKADSLNIAIQDGPESGQSIPHLHTHLIPRYKIDNLKGDSVHQNLENLDLNQYLEDFEQRRIQHKLHPQKFKSDDERTNRSMEEMEKEAQYLASQFEKFKIAQ